MDFERQGPCSQVSPKPEIPFPQPLDGRITIYLISKYTLNFFITFKLIDLSFCVSVWWSQWVFLESVSFHLYLGSTGPAQAVRLV